MLRIYLIITVFILITSCSKEAKYRQQIEDLSSRWQELVTKTAALSSDDSKAIADWQQIYHQVYGDTGSLDTLTEEQTSALNLMKINCLAHGDTYISIQESLDEEVQYIESNGVSIQMLMLDLEKGELTDSIAYLLDKVTQTLVISEDKIKEWESLFTNTQAECTQTCQKDMTLQ